MARIVIEDLVESLELDRQALTKIVGGQRPTPLWQSGYPSRLVRNAVPLDGPRTLLGLRLKLIS
jgi:hypothetical protein